MIGKVTGRVDYVAEDHALIEAAGVGYIVHCSGPTLAALPGAGGMASLYTEMVVREDLMQLYGFPTVAERDWHRMLTSVQGVGARVSLAILGTLGARGVARALAAGDAQAIKAAPGVGPKLAARVVSELKGKAPAMIRRGAASAAMPVTGTGTEDPAGPPPAPAAQMAAPPAAEDGTGAAMADALSALVNLGYERGEAAEAVARAAAEHEGTQALIRAALKALAPGDLAR